MIEVFNFLLINSKFNNVLIIASFWASFYC